jgi:hypothetical protein
MEQGSLREKRGAKGNGRGDPWVEFDREIENVELK